MVLNIKEKEEWGGRVFCSRVEDRKRFKTDSEPKCIHIRKWIYRSSTRKKNNGLACRDLILDYLDHYPGVLKPFVLSCEKLLDENLTLLIKKQVYIYICS